MVPEVFGFRLIVHVVLGEVIRMSCIIAHTAQRLFPTTSRSAPEANFMQSFRVSGRSHGDTLTSAIPFFFSTQG